MKVNFFGPELISYHMIWEVRFVTRNNSYKDYTKEKIGKVSWYRNVKL